MSRSEAPGVTPKMSKGSKGRDWGAAGELCAPGRVLTARSRASPAHLLHRAADVKHQEAGEQPEEEQKRVPWRRTSAAEWLGATPRSALAVNTVFLVEGRASLSFLD